MKVVVAGSVAQRAGYAGHAWVFVQWLVGLQDLGHEVLFVDVLDPGDDPSADGAAAGYLEEQLRHIGEHVPVAVLGWSGSSVSREEARRFTRSSAVLFNVMGFLADEELLDDASLRVFVDIDPGFGQMWHDLGLADVFAGHDAFVTVGGNVGSDGCGVPTCGRDWLVTRPPVVLRHWPVTGSSRPAFTTVASWRGPFGPVEHRGRTYGLRVHEFRRFLTLPSVTGAEFELALDIHEADTGDLDALEASGWRLVRPDRVASSLRGYRDYVQSSRAELMVAKHMYVATGSGWFSDRSACYLASGRPVLAQDTGLDDLRRDGHGLVLFGDLDEAAAGVRSIVAAPDRHAAAARELAEQALAADVVLPRLLQALGLPTRS